MAAYGAEVNDGGADVAGNRDQGHSMTTTAAGEGVEISRLGDDLQGPSSP
jgi:hypothetical protein